MSPSLSRVAALAPMALLILSACGDSTGPRGDPCTTARGELSIGGTQTARLSPSSACMEGGWLTHRWLVELTAPAAVQIDLTSAQFNTFLVVATVDGDEFVAADDDSGDGTDSRVVWRLGAGAYYVIATSFNAGESGSYEISMRAPAASHPCIAEKGTLTLNEPVTGALSESACQLWDRTFADAWRLDVTTPARLRIDLSSWAYDAFLFVTDERGVTVAWDEDGGPEFDARIDRDFAPGRYTVWSNSSLVATGPYTLSAQLAP